MTPQDSHCSPPTPHDVAVGGIVHTLSLQHPVGQDVDVHTQLPFWQA